MKESQNWSYPSWSNDRCLWDFDTFLQINTLFPSLAWTWWIRSSCKFYWGPYSLFVWTIQSNLHFVLIIVDGFGFVVAQLGTRKNFLEIWTEYCIFGQKVKFWEFLVVLFDAVLMDMKPYCVFLSAYILLFTL